MLIPALLATTGCTDADPSPANKLVGSWRMVSAQVDPDGRNLPAYGQSPNGLLVFTSDMRFVAVLTDGDLPRFASDVRGEGADEENRAAMRSNIGFFGRYAVDRNGDFASNRVDGSTFPNWVGDQRDRSDLSLTIHGDRMVERFERPDGTQILINWRRADR